jgi:hypothetical protein
MLTSEDVMKVNLRQENILFDGQEQHAVKHVDREVPAFEIIVNDESDKSIIFERNV